MPKSLFQKQKTKHYFSVIAAYIKRQKKKKKKRNYKYCNLKWHGDKILYVLTIKTKLTDKRD